MKVTANYRSIDRHHTRVVFRAQNRQATLLDTLDAKSDRVGVRAYRGAQAFFAKLFGIAKEVHLASGSFTLNKKSLSHYLVRTGGDFSSIEFPEKVSKVTYRVFEKIAKTLENQSTSSSKASGLLLESHLRSMALKDKGVWRPLKTEQDLEELYSQKKDNYLLKSTPLKTSQRPKIKHVFANKETETIFKEIQSGYVRKAQPSQRKSTPSYTENIWQKNAYKEEFLGRIFGTHKELQAKFSPIYDQAHFLLFDHAHYRVWRALLLGSSSPKRQDTSLALRLDFDEIEKSAQYAHSLILQYSNFSDKDLPTPAETIYQILSAGVSLQDEAELEKRYKRLQRKAEKHNYILS